MINQEPSTPRTSSRIEGGIFLIAPAGFVVMKKPPIGGAAAIGRGHDGR